MLAQRSALALYGCCEDDLVAGVVEAPVGVDHAVGAADEHQPMPAERGEVAMRKAVSTVERRSRDDLESVGDAAPSDRDALAAVCPVEVVHRAGPVVPVRDVPGDDSDTDGVSDTGGAA